MGNATLSGTAPLGFVDGALPLPTVSLSPDGAIRVGVDFVGRSGRFLGIEHRRFFGPASAVVAAAVGCSHAALTGCARRRARPGHLALGTTALALPTALALTLTLTALTLALALALTLTLTLALGPVLVLGPDLDPAAGACFADPVARLAQRLCASASRWACASLAAVARRTASAASRKSLARCARRRLRQRTRRSLQRGSRLWVAHCLRRGRDR